VRGIAAGPVALYTLLELDPLPSGAPPHSSF